MILVGCILVLEDLWAGVCIGALACHNFSNSIACHVVWILSVVVVGNYILFEVVRPEPVKPQVGFFIAVLDEETPVVT